MTLTLKAILVALPVAAVVATASTLAALNIPWKVLPGNAGALVAARQWHPVSDELATVEQEPALTAEPQVPTTKAISVVDVPQPPVVVEPTEGAAPPVPVIPTALSELRDEDESVDYSRLNMDVHVVTSTLERFNQKLLRMIAQARASQTGSQPPVSPDAGPTVALDAPNPAPAISGEVSQ
jgi:hypothetical protein